MKSADFLGFKTDFFSEIFKYLVGRFGIKYKYCLITFYCLNKEVNLPRAPRLKVITVTGAKRPE